LQYCFSVGNRIARVVLQRGNTVAAQQRYCVDSVLLRGVSNCAVRKQVDSVIDQSLPRFFASQPS
jgi:hypothetical protein